MVCHNKILEMNTNIKETDLCYWAGFIDGEGSVKLYKHPKKNSLGKVYDCYMPKIEVTNTDILLIEQMIKTFQTGYIYLDKPRKDRKSTRLNSSHVSESRMPSSA